MVALLIEETTNQLNQNKSNQMKIVFFGERGKQENTDENLTEQKRELTNSNHVWRRGQNRTKATLVEGECSHHCANLALYCTNPALYCTNPALYCTNLALTRSTALAFWNVLVLVRLDATCKIQHSRKAKTVSEDLHRRTLYQSRNPRRPLHPAMQGTAGVFSTVHKKKRSEN